MEAKDALGVTVPLCVLPSQDEDPNLMKEFQANLKVPNYMETYDKVPHGWMSARGDMVNEPGKSEFERGYKQALKFL